MIENQSEKPSDLRLFFIDEFDFPALEQLQLLYGSKSLFALHEDFFIKILPKKPFVHDVLLKHSPFTNENAPLIDLYKYSPRLLAWKELIRSDIKDLIMKKPHLAGYLKNVDLAYLYVFERRELIKIHQLLSKKLLLLDKEIIAKIMNSLIYTINLLQMEGFTYHDLCDDNLLWDVRTQQPFLIDLDSAVPTHLRYEEAQKYLEGQHTYHRVYLYLRRNKEYRRHLKDLRLFGSCLIFNYFITLLTTSLTKKYNMMNYYARELSRILVLKTAPMLNEIQILLNNARYRGVLQRSLEILLETIETEQPGRINALLGLLRLL